MTDPNYPSYPCINNAVQDPEGRTKTVRDLSTSWPEFANYWGIYQIAGNTASLVVRVKSARPISPSLGLGLRGWLIQLAEDTKKDPARLTVKLNSCVASSIYQDRVLTSKWFLEGKDCLQLTGLPSNTPSQPSSPLEIAISAKFEISESPAEPKPTPVPAPKPRQGLLFPDDYEAIGKEEPDLPRAKPGTGFGGTSSPKGAGDLVFFSGLQEVGRIGGSGAWVDPTLETKRADILEGIPCIPGSVTRLGSPLVRVVELARKKAPSLPLRVDATATVPLASKSLKQAAIYAIFGVFAEQQAVWVPVAGMAEILFEAGVTKSKDPRSLGDFLGLGKGGLNLEKAKLGKAVYVKNPLLA